MIHLEISHPRLYLYLLESSCQKQLSNDPEKEQSEKRKILLKSIVLNLQLESNDRVGRSHLNKYCESVSTQLNRAAQRVIEDLRREFIRSKKFRYYWSELHSTSFPKNYGNIKKGVPQLQRLSALEQMLLINEWFYSGEHDIKKHRYTLLLSNGTERLRGRKIPFSLAKGAKSLLQAKLGNRAHDYPAIKYDDGAGCWAENDPWRSIENENFVYHLEALEMVRQTEYIAATLIKGCAFESDYIGTRWRYGTKGREACVEFTKQRRLSKEKQKIRNQSAAFNLFKMMKDEDLRNDADLCLQTYSDDGQVYRSVTPGEIFEAYQQGPEALVQVMFHLMFAKMGPFSSTRLQRFVDRKLEPAR